MSYIKEMIDSPSSPEGFCFHLSMKALEILGSVLVNLVAFLINSLPYTSGSHEMNQLINEL